MGKWGNGGIQLKPQHPKTLKPQHPTPNPYNQSCYCSPMADS
ncbi:MULTISPECIES: hypothetical protein [unclassified Microcystis]|nr:MULTISPECIES: hypothetical protein [unclassified Microcystis]